MSKLEELLEDYCPDGVEFRKIKEVADCIAGATPSKTKYEYWENGTIPWLSSGEVNKVEIFDTDTKITQLGYDNSSTKMVPENTVVIALAGQGKTRGTVAITHLSLCTNQSLCSIVTKDELNPRFLFHYLRGQYGNLRKLSSGDGGRGGLNLKIIGNIEIPVPPLPVQEEIVRILDMFTGLTAELTAELTARKKQYEYYRDQMLAFDGNENSSLIGDVCNISAGGDIPKNSLALEKDEKHTVPIISNGIGENAIYGYTDKAKIKGEAVTVAARGTIGYAEYRNYDYYPIVRLITLQTKDANILNTKFLYYSLQGRKYRIPTSGIPQLTVPKLKKEQIYIPTMNVQLRIVNILDHFDTLCSDISTGLPAEIEARQKQYEYYRDKLLTFKRKA